MGISARGQSNRQAVVIGLDGVPCSLLKAYLDRGTLPNLARILGRGYRLAPMNAAIPEVSSTSWTSFMTGVNPGEHGIFGFMEVEDGNYKLRFPNSRDVNAPTVWEMLGMSPNGKRSTLGDRYRNAVRTRRRSIVLNVPQTYPAAPLNGIMTAGFVAPDLRKATYPESAYHYLKSVGYLSDVDASKAIGEREGFLRDLSDAVERRKIAFDHFLRNEEWDLFIATVTETDRLHHFFYDASVDEGHPLHGFFLSFYRSIDQFIGETFDHFMDRTDGNGLFMTMSDHGFARIDKEIYLNSFLRQEGFLVTNEEREYFHQIEPGTKAFAMDPGRIYIHLERKYRSGSVRRADRKAVLTDLKAALTSLKDESGREIITRVWENEELYSGPSAGRGPDLVCSSADGYDLKGTLKKKVVLGKEHFNGMHTRHDAHCVLPGGLGDAGRVHIENLADFLMAHFTGR